MISGAPLPFHQPEPPPPPPPPPFRKKWYILNLKCQKQHKIMFLFKNYIKLQCKIWFVVLETHNSIITVFASEVGPLFKAFPLKCMHFWWISRPYFFLKIKLLRTSYISFCRVTFHLFNYCKKAVPCVSYKETKDCRSLIPLFTLNFFPSQPQNTLVRNSSEPDSHMFSLRHSFS